MTTAIIGRTGTGKSFTAKGMVEIELAAGARVCVIDPTGAWWGLRLAADGQSEGFPVVIFGGDHADVPIDDGHGAQLADLVVAGEPRQCVIDVSDMSGNEQTRFLTAFLERLYTKNRHPILLVLDEADVMAPQNPMPDQRRLQGAVNKIVRRGRIKGFRPIMITQRPAVLDKSVMSMIDRLIAMQLTSPQDRKAIEDWVKGNADGAEAKAVLGSLASLPRGEGWYWEPGAGVLERRAFPPIASFDSGRTPEPGEEIRDVAPLALPELAAMRAMFVASSPSKGTTTPPASASGSAPAAAIAADLAAAERRGYERGLEDGRAAILVGIRANLEAAGVDLAARLRQIGQDLAPAAPAALLARVKPLKPRVESRPKSEVLPGALNSAARKMLAVLDTQPPVRRSWTQVAHLAGLRASGGHYNAGRKAMRDQGLVVEDGPLVAIAQPSAEAGPAVSDPGHLVATWRDLLSGAGPKILEALYHAGGSARREDIAATLGMKPSGGHWNSAWKELRDNDIVVVDGAMAQLTELFRPAGSP